ncbi:helix-turn-helix domain-containing protein [Roseomonas sp. WA12]
MANLSKPMLGRGVNAQKLKQELGDYIKSRRTALGYTQAQLAKAVGMEYYTAVSAIELGRNVVPPERYYAFSKALGIDPQEFMKVVLQKTNPWAYVMLFAADPKSASDRLNAFLPERFAASGKPSEQDG